MYVDYLLGAVNTAEWLPTNIGGCVLWLRSDLGVTKDGVDRVSEWADQSGQNNHATQAVDAKKPVWTANQLNGHAVLRWDAVDDRLDNVGLDGTVPLTVFIVGQHANDVSNHYFMDDGVVGNQRAIANFGTQGRIGMYAGVILSDDGYDTSVYRYLTYIFNGANSNIYVNGVSKATGNSGANAQNGYTLGAHFSGGSHLAGDIAEVIIYSSALAAGDRGTVESYLSMRYGL